MSHRPSSKSGFTNSFLGQHFWQYPSNNLLTHTLVLTVQLLQKSCSGLQGWSPSWWSVSVLDGCTAVCSKHPLYDLHFWWFQAEHDVDCSRKSNGIYSQWPLNILESSFLLNLAVLSVVTGYFLNNGENQEILSCASATVAFVTFIGIMLFHTYKLVKGIRAWQYFAVHFQQKHQDPPAPRVSEPSIQSSAIPQFDQYREPLLTND